jgi:hypothetical protein
MLSRIQMSQALQDAPLTALSEGGTIDYSLTDLPSDGDYTIAADAISRLINKGRLKLGVV